MAREVDRPYFQYQNLFHDPRASAGERRAVAARRRARDDPLVLGYFQLDAGGRVTTPTINDERARAVGRRAPGGPPAVPRRGHPQPRGRARAARRRPADRGAGAAHRARAAARAVGGHRAAARRPGPGRRDRSEQLRAEHHVQRALPPAARGRAARRRGAPRRAGCERRSGATGRDHRGAADLADAAVRRPAVAGRGPPGRHPGWPARAGLRRRPHGADRLARGPRRRRGRRAPDRRWRRHRDRAGLAPRGRAQPPGGGRRRGRRHRRGARLRAPVPGDRRDRAASPRSAW